MKMCKGFFDKFFRIFVLVILASGEHVSGDPAVTTDGQCATKAGEGQESSSGTNDCPSGKPVSPLTEEIAKKHEKKNIAQPALTLSLFSNVPPTINFVRPDQQVEELPPAIRSRLKYYGDPSSVIAGYISRSGFTHSTDAGEYTFYFSLPYQINETKYYQMVRPYQKFNHFPDSWILGCKDKLAGNLLHFKIKYGSEEYGFFPRTFILPFDRISLKRAWDSTEKGAWILKPSCTFGGNGIEVVNDWKQIPENEYVVVQRYIPNPILCDGFKMDLRLYVHVTSIDPLRIYLLNEGSVRISAKKYTMDDLHNRAIHLTNRDVVPEDSGYFVDENMERGNRRSFTWLWGYLKEKYGVEHQPIWDSIKDVVIKTILTGEAKMRKSTRAFIKNRYSVHELFGFDILLDEDLKAWLMEVNVSPRFPRNILKRVTQPMLASMLNLAGVQIPAAEMLPKLKHSTEEDAVPEHLVMNRNLWTQPLTDEEKTKHAKYTGITDEVAQQSILDKLTPDDIRMLVETVGEYHRRGDFERIFPAPDTKKYHKFFKKPR
ncbi:tubulin polyglutamylase TTLL4 isoform X2 [Lingula anatina]|nr:tubulin polyglutamylase TTLL4 isoform X2 [Lingula anatina]|eukprot:XP_013397586.1 tubulin polyglutamylase TTLL4 isoform X2 [Lingula anatina]